MGLADDIRNIASEIFRAEAGGPERSQAWGLRLRLIADKVDKASYPAVERGRAGCKAVPKCQIRADIGSCLDTCRYFPPAF